MKKSDGILIFIVILIAGIFYFIYNFQSDTGASVIVSVDGEVYGTYNLMDDQVIYINETNILEIKDGYAYMLEAECPDGLCMLQGMIHRDNESIICLPNKVVIEVEGAIESEYDVTVQ
ncbi:MAG: NusG domain II-containing protein [Eubacteriales bacterium]